ncbi:tumor necrosis factor receptor superfamily member 14 isoform X2 [Pelobates cultripes]|uniref:Tumor necrosis factor receptor superfamily member 14 isoform X2 n=1 Tax=Pelobates cultripes TaxID=61616 RepID=A0AAD1T6D4_PELCU|nr:tumor necrosis factor receptor superfamily member 14 isoform X2 [Pelobates cultripes]
MARVVFSACLPGEYEYEGECCPQCPSGNVVKNHCTDAVSTVCIPCVDNTYMDHPNGETKCLRCKICDKGAGLVTKKACTYTSNTVCDCERGSFCRSVSGKECDMCERHKTCPPGEMVKRYDVQVESLFNREQVPTTPSAKLFMQGKDNKEKQSIQETRPFQPNSDLENHNS